ncbi:putative transcription factor/ chromatin remodeling BED-type(Zn) family [Helianthus annuus]|nr:putative transcription factor/ chromatin remodeling BED-type(Zn) family [Helianthus annuus]
MSESQKKVGKKKDKKDKKSNVESDSIKVDLENDSSMNMDVEDDEVHSVEVDDTNDSDDNKSGVKRQRKERSIVWQYFTKLKKKAVGGKVPSKCNKCNHIIIYDSKQAVVLDPRYKLHFIEWSYSQVYGRDSKEYEYVDEVLHSTFHEYVELNMDGSSSTTSNVASTSDASKGVDETGDDDSTSVFGVRARLKDFDQFQSKDFLANKKSELQLYLDESRVDRNSNLDVLTFWKANEFRYPTLARMARDFLTIPVSTVASESTFSASGRVLNEHRSSLGKDTVEALICTKDWLYGDYCSNEVNLDELTEDIMSLDISGESNASNSMNNSKV